MGREQDIHNLRSERVVVGLSTIHGVTVLPGQVGVLVKYFSGGTLEIGGQSLTWDAGYIFADSEAISIDSAGSFYLAATGATVTAMVLKGLSAGQD